ncbi:MAG: EAL domain-containing protein [Gammaproteobacteria bacterium]|nr:MAG: EAL domain-containing protein [Gammaproteobacteria bacterium]
MLGRTREQLARENDAVIAAAERGIRTETRYVRSDGSGGWTELYRRALPTDSGVLIVTIARDVTERRAQQEKIERLNRVYAMLSGINAAIVHIRDRDELFRECCRIAHEAGGFDAVSIHLIDPQKLIAEPVAWHGRREMMEWLRQGRFSVGVEKSAAQSLPVELIKTRRPATTNDALHDPRVQFKDALARFGINSVAFLPLIVSDRVTGVMTMYSPFKGHFDEAEIRLLSGLAADISFAVEHLEKSERATYLALYDELTGLANRQLLAERLGQFIHVARHAQARLALALLDIERLRSVNNSLGRRAGDALLRQVGERLARAAGATATARVASNHFAVVLPAVRDRPDAGRKMAALTRACFAEPYTVDGTELKVRARTGLVVFPTDGADTETLLVNAETALRKAKQTGERQVFYTPDLSERTAAWLPLETKLLGALEKDEFVLYYQPKVDTKTRRIVGLEALLRWILDVGAWALQRAALDHRSWIEQGLTPLRVAVNVSPVQLRQHDFVQAVAQAIQKGVTPSGIDLELTESLVMEDVEENIRKLNHVRDLGLRVAIDDFGTGYSSLGYLAKLPVQALKIDRSFIISLLTDSTARTLVQTINSLAHTLGLEVIAEGVEEEEQAKALLLMHCDQIQGYLISRPVPFDEMTRLLRVSRLGNGTAR